MSDCVPRRHAFLVKDWRPDRQDHRTLEWYAHRNGYHLVDEGNGPVQLAEEDATLMVPDWTLAGPRPPRVLLCYVHWPTCVGAHLKTAFRMVGCTTRSVGPLALHAWGRPTTQLDFEWPDFELADEPVDIGHVLAVARSDGFDPDVVIMCDHYDDFYLTGSGRAYGVKFVHIAVENWDYKQLDRAAHRIADSEYYCVRHWEDGTSTDGVPLSLPRTDLPPPPLVDGAQLLVWGFDPCTRPYLNVPRDKWVAQVGRAYEPRPTVWNLLRRELDGAAPLTGYDYNASVGGTESAHTYFGWARPHRAMADIYNRAQIVLSSSNQDFVPNRVPDAFATGAVLLSDDTPALRTAFGRPWPEDPTGLWIAHNRTPGHILERIRWLLAHPEVQEEIRSRALIAAYTQHTYGHRARAMLTQLGLTGAGRLL